jgi:transposase InsO family protein
MGVGVTDAADRFGVSRKTACKWLARHDADPEALLDDRPRTPRTSPGRTPPAVERLILGRRDRFGWGARKIRADLMAHGQAMPSARTVHAVLERAGRVRAPEPCAPAPIRFERAAPNELWQIDFKACPEVDRRRVEQFTVLDDHSRFLVALHTGLDASMATAWDVLWRAFGRVGLPEAVLSDNAFGCKRERPRTVSWFESRLIRLGIRPIHGRPYHPQTQGKIERLHGTLERECYPTARRDSVEHFDQDCRRWRPLYNNRRPHEALGDRPPISRWTPSPRPRPPTLPEVEYPTGSIVRRVATSGEVYFNRYRIVAGRGLAGEHVAIQETDTELIVRYADHPVRRIPTACLAVNTML